MATIHGRYQLRIKDQRGAYASTNAHFKSVDSATIAQLNTAFQTWALLVNAVTGGAITAQEVHLDVPITLTPNSPSSNIGDGVVLSFPTSVGKSYSDFLVPAVATAAVVNGKPDMTEGSVIDLLADYMEAVFQVASAGDSNFETLGQVALAPIASGLLSDRKYRKIMRKTKTVGV